MDCVMIIVELGACQQVVAPSASGPAERGGIKPLDRVLAIGGKSTQGMSLYEAGDLLQGADGSEVWPQRTHLHAPAQLLLPPHDLCSASSSDGSHGAMLAHLQTVDLPCYHPSCCAKQAP